jgi:hypothetical protein
VARRVETRQGMDMMEIDDVKMKSSWSWICLFCGRDLKPSEKCTHRDDFGSYNLIGLFSEEEKVIEREKLRKLKADSKYPKCWEPTG